MNKRLFNILLGLALVMGVMLGVNKATYAADPQAQNTNYLTFTGEDQFTLSTNDNKRIWDGNMEYSTDTASWTEWDGSEGLTSSGSDSGSGPYVLYLRGKNKKTLVVFLASIFNWISLLPAQVIS